MPSMLYAVQDQDGREIVSAHVDVEKVSDVTASGPLSDGRVRLMFEDVVIETGDYFDEGKLTLYRWPSDAKLDPPVSHPVK